jgi:hypothetical protein
MPTIATAAQVEVTDLQQSIFNAPVPGAAGRAGVPPKQPGGADHLMKDAGTPESRGTKRPRDDDEDSEESDSDVAMEEDSDDE